MGEPGRLLRVLRNTSNPIGSRLVGRICAELERLRAADQAIAGVREACALQDVPVAELPAAVEQLLSELADRQIRHDIEPREFQAGCDEFAVSGMGSTPGRPVGDPEDDEW